MEGQQYHISEHGRHLLDWVPDLDKRILEASKDIKYAGSDFEGMLMHDIEGSKLLAHIQNSPVFERLIKPNHYSENPKQKLLKAFKHFPAKYATLEKNPDSPTWKIGTPHKLETIEAKQKDFLLATGVIAQKFMSEDELFDMVDCYEQPFSSIAGMLGAHAINLVEGDTYEGFCWDFKHPDGTTHKKRVWKASHGDFSFDQFDITDHMTSDFFGNPSLYRPQRGFAEKDLYSRGAHHIETNFLYVLLRYIHNHDIPSRLINEPDLLLEMFPNDTESSAESDMHRYMVTTPLNNIAHYNDNRAGTSDSFLGHELAIGENNELVIGLNKEIPYVQIFPDEIDYALQSTFYSGASASGGRTPVWDLHAIVDWYRNGMDEK